MYWEDWFQDAGSLGGFTAYLAVILLFWLLEQNNPAWQLFISLAIIVLLIVATRLLHFKNRPAKHPYASFIEKIQSSSFPSGHAARITSLLIITGHVVKAPYFSALAVLLVLVVCWSRISLKKHDGVDVLFGIILGTAVSLATILLLPE